MIASFHFPHGPITTHDHCPERTPSNYHRLFSGNSWARCANIRRLRVKVRTDRLF